MLASYWKISEDNPTNVLELSGFWPPTAPRVLRIDKREGQISLKPLVGEPIQIPFSSLRGLRFLVGPATRGRLRLQLSILYSESSSPKVRSLVFRVAQLDKSEEALDLIFRIAQIVGYPSYVLHQKDEHGIDLELRAESDDPFRSDAQSAKQVPAIEGPANYQEELKSTKTLYELSKQDPKRPKFVGPLPYTMPEPRSHRAVKEWDAGKKIVLRNEPGLGPIGTFFYLFLGLPLTLLVWSFIDILQLSLALMVGTFGIIILAMPMALIEQSLGADIPPWMIAIPAALVGIAIGLFFLFRIWQAIRYVVRCILWCFSRDVTLDLENGSLTLARARYFWTRLSLARVDAITLVQKENKMFKWYLSKDTLSKESSWYEVRARIGWVSVHLWEGEEKAAPERNESYILAILLAQALDVPFREE